MGKVLSVISRKARRFNAENRAHRYLDKEKLAAAPKYQSNINDYQRVLEDNPNFVQHESRKHTQLDDRLKHVYVTSTDRSPKIDYSKAENPNRESTKPLPLDRQPVENFEFGFLEPEKVSRGRTTLRQALKFIGDHQTEPQNWTAEKISNEYKLQPTIVENILTNFHTFEIFIPDVKVSNKLLVRDRLRKLWEEPKPLPPPKYKEDEDEFERLRRQHDENERKKEPKI